MNRPTITATVFLSITWCAAAAPARAEALAGYEIVSSETAATSSATKQLSVTCPSGKSALGAGWAVLDDTDVILNGAATYFAPSWDGSSWLVNAQNTSLYSTTWKLKVQVQCATTPSSYEVVTAETSATSVAKKQVQASCPSGKSALGAGWAVLDDTSAILEGEALYFAPSWDGSSWLANGQNHSGFASTWKLQTQVICADLAGYEVVVASTAVSSAGWKQQIAACPSGKVVGGAGWAVLDDTAVILDGDELYFFPSWDGASWITNASSSNMSLPPDWQLRNWLLCVSN